MLAFSFDQFPILEPFIRWCAATWLGTYMHSASWAFKFIETVHIVVWVVLLGTTMMVNLRLLGLLRGWTPEQIAGSVRWFVNGSLAMVLLTGSLLFLADPWKYYANVAFGPKILFFVVVACYQFAVYPRVVRGEPRLWGRVAAGVSLLLWFYVGAAGRAIAVV